MYEKLSFYKMQSLDFIHRLFNMHQKCERENSSFVNFGRGLARAIYKCAIVGGLTKLTRPEKSLHFLFLNPDSNLHFIFNPICSLQFLNPSLLRSATLHKEGFKVAKKLPPMPFLPFLNNSFSISVLILPI